MSASAGIATQTAPGASFQKPDASDSPAAIAAKQALAKAQACVDADRRAHSPGCVAVDQKGVAKAQAALAAADAANSATTVAASPGTPGSFSVTA